MLDEISFADAGWPNQNDILLRVLSLFRPPRIFLLQPPEVIGVIIMITHRDREHLFRFILLDHKAVEMRFDVTREKIENELLMIGFLWLLFHAGFGRLRLGEGRDRDAIAEVRFHELGDLCL